MKGKAKTALSIGATLLGGIVLIIGKGKREPQKYSYDWIYNLSNKDWETERNKIWERWANPNQDSRIRDELWSLMQLFDKVKSNKDWAGKKPQGPAYHREHGFNLYKPD